jgi:hypothetical protein
VAVVVTAVSDAWLEPGRVIVNASAGGGPFTPEGAFCLIEKIGEMVAEVIVTGVPTLR